PTRYSRGGGKLTFWPAPDLTTYAIPIDAYQSLGAFAADTDVSTLDDEAIMELSIGVAKMHYGQQDGAALLQMVNALITRLNESDEISGRLDVFNNPQHLASLSGVKEAPVQQGIL
ncbi:MAG: hypothetical protein ACREJM_11595, partial [Candidatus Saccharimonadales bacterium]